MMRMLRRRIEEPIYDEATAGESTED